MPSVDSMPLSHVNLFPVGPSYRASETHPVVLNQSKVEDGHSPHGMSQDAGKSGRDMKLDINVNDDIASVSAAPVLRIKSGNRLSRHLSESSCDDFRPLLRDQPQIRRASTEDLRNSLPRRQHSFRDDVGHAAAETYLITRLSFRLLIYLGLGYRWITKLMALGLYAMFLMPGFLQVAYKYFFSKHVHRSLVYGDQPRNSRMHQFPVECGLSNANMLNRHERLDLYLPEGTSTPKPVVIFITGGAWVIGYKAWGSLLGLQLCERNIIVCCVDYRNFPQGVIGNMVEDVATGIGFVVNNISQYGGDPDRIYLAGQSAGSHLAACALIDQARIEIGQKEGKLVWKCCKIKGFLGISGGYNLPKLVDHFHKRGLYRSIFLSMMEGETSLPLYSPEMAVRSDAFAGAVQLLPPIYLFHGTADYSIPCEASANFGEALSSVGATVNTRFYPEKTHTDVFLQDPLRGGRDELFEDVLAVVHADDEEARANDAKADLRPRLVPEFLLRLARWISPF